MSKEVLKFGALIVDALREYKQPICIYIVGELRGGAWVVVDPSINSEMMEMYCYENARGGVLEPQGIVEIKYRTQRIISTMERLDPEYMRMKELLLIASEEDKVKLSFELKKMEKALIPIYEQAAVELADLHDRPQRMLAKKVIKKVIEWSQARSFFYWRIMRRTKEVELCKILRLEASYAHDDALNLVSAWFSQQHPAGTDKDFVEWYTRSQVSLGDRISHLKEIQIQKQLTSLATQSPSALLEALASSFRNLSSQEKEDLLGRLNFL